MISKKTKRGQPRSRLAARVARAPARHKCFIAVSVCRSCARAPCVDYSTFILSKNGLRDTRTVVCLGLSSDHSHATLSLRTSARSGTVMMALWPTRDRAALLLSLYSDSVSLPPPPRSHSPPTFRFATSPSRPRASLCRRALGGGQLRDALRPALCAVPHERQQTMTSWSGGRHVT